MPLALIWLAAHAALLVLILKFLTAKAVAVMLMTGALLWLVLGRTRRIALPPPPGMV